VSTSKENEVTWYSSDQPEAVLLQGYLKMEYQVRRFDWSIGIKE